MGDVSLPFGANNSGTNDWSDVHSNDQAIVDVLNGNVDDDNLASPNNSVYRTLLSAKGIVGVDQAASTYMLGSSYGSVSAAMNNSGSALTLGNIPVHPPEIFYFDDADYTVAGKTPKLRLRCQVAANGTAPGITFTFGLRPITVAGSADALTYTAGTVVSGSTVAIASPSASTVTSGVNSDFTVPSDGAYALCVVTSGTIANNAAVGCHAQLQVRHV